MGHGFAILIPFSISVAQKLLNPPLRAENQVSSKSCNMQNFAKHIFLKIMSNWSFLESNRSDGMIPCNALRSSKLINVLVRPDNQDFKKNCRMQSFCLYLSITQELQTIIKGNAGVKRSLLAPLQVLGL